MTRIKTEKIMYGDQELEISCNMAVISDLQEQFESLRDVTVSDWLIAMITDALYAQGWKPAEGEDVLRPLFRGLRLTDYSELRTKVLDLIVDSLALVPAAPEADPKNVETAPEA